MVRRREDPEWREFERLVSRIEADARDRGWVVKSPDRIRCQITGRLREVDASIRAAGSPSSALVTIECRKRAKVEDVTWIEQLATKRSSIGADHTIAVSIAGFSKDAELVAAATGISLRKVSELSVDDLGPLLGLGMVIFWHKGCALAGAGIRIHRPGDEAGPPPQRVDYFLPRDVDLFAAIFKDEADGRSWSLNDVWHAVQEALNPFAEIEKGEPPVIKTARVPYPKTVTVETPEGPQRFAELYLGMAMWIEPELVTAADALKVDYADLAGGSLQRIEFSSARTKNWRLSLQAPAGSNSFTDLRTGREWPENASQRSTRGPTRNQD